MKRKYERTNEISGEIIDREIQALAIHKGVVVNADLSMGCAIKLECDYTPLLNSAVVEGTHNALRSALNTLPENFDIQIIWRQHHRTKEMADMIGKETSSPGLVGEVQVEARQLFLDNLAAGRLRWIEVYFLVIRRCPFTRKQLRKRSSAFVKNRPGMSALEKMSSKVFGNLTDHALFRQYQGNEYLEALNELRNNTENLRRLFQEEGWEPKILDDQGALNLFYARWNRSKYEAGLEAPTYRPDEQIPVSEYFAHSPVEWTRSKREDIAAGTIIADGQQHRIVSLHLPGAELTFPYFEDILLHAGLNGMEMVMNITRGSRIKRIKELQLKLRQSKGKKDNPIEREQLVQLDAELEELGANLEHIWRASIHFILWSSDPDKLKADVLRLMTEVSKQGSTVVEETHAAWAYWRATQPFWTQDHDRYRMLEYSTRQLVCMLPLCGHPSNISPDKPLGVLYESSCGTIFNWVLPDGKLFTSPHHFIVGDTGSGKSMFEDEKQIALRRLGAKSVIIDLGRSYYNFCMASGGVYVDYNLDSAANRINPFYLDPNTLPTPELMRSRTLWLEQLVRDRGQPLGTDDIELLEEAVQSTYARLHGRQEILLRNVRDTLQGLPKPRAAILGGRLGSWCADSAGSKGKLFDGPTQINFNVPVVVFDLKHVARDNKDPELLRIIFNSIMATVSALASVEAREPKLLSFDEAGEIVKDPANAQFLEYCYRTLRKNGVIVAAMTQDIDDFVTVNPDLANIIVGSVENRVVLKQNNATKVRRIAEVLGLNSAEVAVVAALTTGPGRFSELLLLQTTAKKRRSFRLTSASTPLRYAFTCNSRNDAFALDQIQKSKPGMSRLDAIRQFAKLYPLGVDNTPKPE